MSATSSDQRSSGIASVPELPWGSHFGVFYASSRELLDAVVPFVRAGLENNEFCSWEVGGDQSVDETTRALVEAIPDFGGYVARGQVEITAPNRTIDVEGAPGLAIEEQLDRAILAGFDGLRLVCHSAAGAGKRAFAEIAGTVRRLNVVAAVAYSRTDVGALDFMQVVRDHRFAVVCNAGQWEVLEGSEARTAREALERSEEKLRSLFSNMSEGFAYHRIVLDAERKPCDYVFLEVNPTFERLTGLDARQIRGKRVTQVLPGIEADPTDWIGKYGRVALTGEPLQFESHAAPLDKWYAVSAFSPHRGYFAVTFADITERKRAEAARQAAEERLLVTLRSIGDGVIATDTEGRVTLMNRVAENLTGWTETEAKGRPLPEVFHIIDDDTGADAEDPVRKVLERGAIVGLANHTTLVARDGRRIAIADSAAPVRGDALLGVVLVFRDVSAARHAERERDLTLYALREAEARLRTLGDQIPGGAIYQHVQPPRGPMYYAYMSAGIERLFGMPAKDVLADPAAFRRLILEEDLPRAAAEEERSAREMSVFDCELRQRTASGEIKWVQCRSKPRRLDDGSIVWDGIVVDITERKRAEQERERLLLEVSHAKDALKVANAQLIDADQRKNQFLGVLSHELRNPLAPIKSGLYVLDRAAPGGDQARRAQAVINRQVDQLARLVDDLLDVTRIARNKIQLQRQRLEINDLARRTIEDHRTLFEQAAVAIEFQPAAGPVFVDADWNRLAQVVGNLVQNAAKFTPQGGTVTVTVSSDPSSRTAAIRVSDTGVGMTADMVSRLFEPFSQADATLDRSKGGLGLGLALVRGLVELHGGEVIASSAGVGRGSEFIVRLPLDASVATDSPDAPAARTIVRRRILVIEDNVDAAEMLRDVLEFSQHDVAVSYNGPEGLERARDFRPDVVLCDIGLPGMSGYDVARALKADPVLHAAYLVALSGYALPEDLRNAADAGFDRHLAKPATLEKVEELLAAIPGVRAV